MAVLSFMFYDLAVIIFSAILGATALSYLGVAVGLEENGFILLLLGIAGAIFGFMFATRQPVSEALVITVTALLGVALAFGGVLLLAGDITLDMIQDEGIIRTVVDSIDQSLIWLVAWFGASLLAAKFQTTALEQELIETPFEYLDIEE
jgi:hypothetical protein